MSSRALRKALKNDELTAAAACLSDEENDILESSKPKTAPQKNAFELFAAFDEDNETASASSSEDNGQTANEESLNSANGNMCSSSNSSKKKKKKKSKGKSVDTANPEDELDQLLAEKQLEFQDEDAEQSEVKESSGWAFDIDPEWLNPEVELKRKFGATTSSVVSELVPPSSRMNNRNSREFRRKTLKAKNGLITPRPFWPPFGPSETGLIVKEDSEKSYIIEETEDYRSNFDEMMLAVNSGDPMLILQFVQAYPLYADALLILSDNYRMQSVADAGEITERALYILERIMPGNFSFVEGDNRFFYNFPSNRKLHLTLFSHIQFTMKKSCWKVSLQLAKILFSLDPVNDPLATRLLLDFLLIQSGQLEEFDAFFDWMENNSSILPGWYYNRALKSFLTEEKAQMNHESSTRLLIEAIVKFPSTMPLLADQCKINIPDSWFQIYHATTEEDQTVQALNKIFVSRCQPLWKTLSVQKWFQTTLKSEAFKEYFSTRETKLSPLSKLKIFEILPIYRHAALSHISNLNVHFPARIISNSSIYAYDPLPPEDFDDEGESLIEKLKNLWRSSFSPNQSEH